jgi:D-alanyl-D-alanine carboxypeptidase (penicillin-binding protein 5/6)
MTGTKNDYINVSGENIRIFNTGILLFFDYIKGVKTGFTNNAGYCLVVYSERQGLKLISVVLKSDQGMRESDMLKMINWANDNYSWKKTVDSSQMYKELEINNEIENKEYIYNTRVFAAVYPEKDFINLANTNDVVEIIDDIAEKNTGKTKSNVPILSIDLPINKGQQIGNLKVIINNEEEQTMQLQSQSKINQQYIFQDLKSGMDNKLRNLIILLISFYFLIFIFIIVRNLFLREK